MNSPRADHPMPPELREALQSEPDRAQLEQVWSILEEARPAAGVDREAEFQADLAAVRSSIRAQTATKTASDPSPRLSAAVRDRGPVSRDRAPRRRRSSRWPLAATALLVLLAVGLAFLTRPVTLTAGAGEMLTASLPDGSTLELNSGSTLTYARGWSWPGFVAPRERRVRLEGEAYFAVSHGQAPFVVETFNAEVTVLGTRFNVRARTKSGTAVTIDEGRVRLAAALATDEQVVLEAGQSAQVPLSRASATITTTAVDQALAWRTGGFAAQDEPLWFILEELERRYGSRLQLARPAVANDSLTVFFPLPVELEAIVRDLATARGLRYSRTSQGFVLQ